MLRLRVMKRTTIAKEKTADIRVGLKVISEVSRYMLKKQQILSHEYRGVIFSG